MSDREWTSSQVREFRMQLGKTQKDFAELARVHIGTLIRWENDKFKPSRMALERLSELYEQHTKGK